MKTTSQATPSSRLPLGALLSAICLVLSLESNYAGSATWDLNPTNGDWNTAANWTPATVPNGPSDTATFDVSNVTTIMLPVAVVTGIEVDSLVFDTGASAYTVIATGGASGSILTVSGSGIANNSGLTQNFLTVYGGAGPSGVIVFQNGATAGSSTVFTNDGALRFQNTSTAGSGIFTTRAALNPTDGPASISFEDSSTAGNGNLTNLGGANPGTGGGVTDFFGTSTAGQAVFANDGATGSSSGGGIIEFFESSSADTGTLTNNGGTIGGAGGGFTRFNDTSTADQATLIAQAGSNGGSGGQILFSDNSTGGSARVEVFGNGTLNLSSHSGPGVTIGSIEGDGLVSLGANKLTDGTNNLNTIFGGVIQDTGSITKMGSGTLTLFGANTYTGGTIISAGNIFATNHTGSATGPGSVQVNAGKLGGTGKIAGNVIIGTGSGRGAFLTPGTQSRFPATLTIAKKLRFRADGTFHFGYKSSNSTADKIVARGVTIDNGAQLFFDPLNASPVTVGTVFIAISNSAGTPIAGTFANVPDGGIITIGPDTFQASYEGGDGNDLSLTVLP